MKIGKISLHCMLKFYAGCPLLIFFTFSFLFIYFFSWHLIFFFHFWPKFSFFDHNVTIQFYILPMGILGSFSSAHTALVCVLGKEVYMQHYWLLVALLIIDNFTSLKIVVHPQYIVLQEYMFRYSGLLIRFC